MDFGHISRIAGAAKGVDIDGPHTCRGSALDVVDQVIPDIRAVGAPDAKPGGGAAFELHERHPDAVRSIMPLPDESATSPNLYILPSPAALAAEDGGGRIVNRGEIGL